ncbi:MAG: RNA methyltransferase [Clostridia bacterium]|nr:RNA methyltransferase [Clostridia bacterium]
MLFLDNVKIIKDTISSKTIVPKYVLTSLSSLDFDCDGAEIYHVDDLTISQLADTKTPQKVLCIAYYTQHIVKKPEGNFLVLDGLQDPGNVGTLIRTAKAAGFDSVFLIDSVKSNNSKLVRSSVGAVFNSNVFEMTKVEFVEFAKGNNLKLICCDMNGENIFEFSCKENVGVVVGNEGQGVSDELASLCFKTVKIPMMEGIESLNAGVSGSIIMYQLNKKLFK